MLPKLSFQKGRSIAQPYENRRVDKQPSRITRRVKPRHDNSCCCATEHLRILYSTSKQMTADMSEHVQTVSAETACCNTHLFLTLVFSFIPLCCYHTTKSCSGRFQKVSVLRHVFDIDVSLVCRRITRGCRFVQANPHSKSPDSIAFHSTAALTATVRTTRPLWVHRILLPHHLSKSTHLEGQFKFRLVCEPLSFNSISRTHILLYV
jgi:hypothetical protein